MKALPEDWNKNFHFVRIRSVPKTFFERVFPKETFYGYIWPTNKWVEVHCFRKMETKRDFHVTEQNCKVNIMSEISAHMVPIQHNMMKLFKATNTYFIEKKKSFIIARDRVFFGSSDVIYCDTKPEDFKRWTDWHPDNEVLTFFEGDDKDWYYGQTHQGELFVQRIEGETLGPLEHAE
jgi:hypothetical protein